LDALFFGALLVIGIVGVLWVADRFGRRPSRRQADGTIEEVPDLLENPGVDLELERIRQQRPGTMV
jgi:hypothetical protein